MRIRTYIFFILIGFYLTQIAFAEPFEKNYGIVNAWFNEQEATVDNINIKINEPAKIKVKIISKINGHIAIYLDNPLVTESYIVTEGPSQMDKRIDVLNVVPGWTETYEWKIKPSGKWINGNAPLNIFVQFTKDIDDYESIEFTIANPYILDEHYSGSSPQPTPDPESTGQASSEGSPGFGVVASLVGVAAVLLIRKHD